MTILTERHEYKGGEFFEYADLCQREATKAFKELRGEMFKGS